MRFPIFVVLMTIAIANVACVIYGLGQPHPNSALIALNTVSGLYSFWVAVQVSTL